MNETVLLSIPLIEWIGYIASTIVLISLSLSSFLRLRIINLIGSALFSFYGFYIGAFPVGIMNLMIVFFNLYYLQRMFFQHDDFDLVEGNNKQVLVHKFVDYFKKDIEKYFPEFTHEPQSNKRVFMLMRNMNFAGLFIAHEQDDCLVVELDYVTPQYRDYKNGIFLFNHFKASIEAEKYKRLTTNSKVPKQVKYLKRVGFVEDTARKNDGAFYLEL